MRVGWCVDQGAPIAGMILQVRAYEAAVPDWVELVRCEPNKRPPADIEAFILHCDLYPRQWIDALEGLPVMAHRHGNWYGGDPIFRRWVLDNANLVTFNSPKQKELFQYTIRTKTALIPTPVDIAKFQAAAERSNGREGWIYLGLLAPVKGVQHTVDWAMVYDHPVDFWGGELYPQLRKKIVPPCRYRGSVPYEQVPDLLARYENFVFMPYDGDLYSRTVIEAWAAGCELVLRGDQQAFWDWFDPEACQNAGKIFWQRFEEVVNAG